MEKPTENKTEFDQLSSGCVNDLSFVLGLLIILILAIICK